MSRKNAPAFVILGLVQNAGGKGLYVGCDIFSRNYALPSGATWVTNDLIVSGGGGGKHEAFQKKTNSTVEI